MSRGKGNTAEHFLCGVLSPNAMLQMWKMHTNRRLAVDYQEKGGIMRMDKTKSSVQTLPDFSKTNSSKILRL